MKEIIRSSTLGYAIRLISHDKTLQYRDESPDFNYSEYFLRAIEDPKDKELDSGEDVESVRNQSDNPSIVTADADSILTVGWYGDNDPENPQNWSNVKKYFVGLLICLYTFSVYVGSSIYVPSERGVMEEFGVGETVASLGLALYVLGYGIGPMLFSPLTEIPSVGRTAPYMVTCTIFVILLVPTALVKNITGLLILRFLLGFFGSPCLATAGASFYDMFPGHKIPYIMGIWAGIATCGPSFGPVISAYSVAAESWRWSQWEILWLAGPTTVLMYIALPETSADTILLHRARRLRKISGKTNLKSQSEVDETHVSAKDIFFNALIKPWEINILDPAVLYTTFFTGLLYGIVYSFFESFPLVYINVYGFSMGSIALAFLSMFIGILIIVPLYMLKFRYTVEAKIKKHGMGPPEDFLTMGLYTCFLAPIGLFIFAWTGRHDVHWIVSMIGVVISTFGLYESMQCLFIYVPTTYPQYAGSLLAANGLARSLMGAAAVLYSPPLFRGLGVDGGVSLLAGLNLVCCGGLWLLWIFGARLRARSRFAVK